MVVSVSATHEFRIDRANPPYASLFVLKTITGDGVTYLIKESDTTALKHNGNVMTEDSIIARHLARTYPSLGLYGQGALEKSQVDHWITVATYQMQDDLESQLKSLNNYLADNTYLVGNQLTLADIFVWIGLKRMATTSQTLAVKNLNHARRWFDLVSIQPSMKDAHIIVQTTSFQKAQKQANTLTIVAKPLAKEKRKDEGKFIDLPGAEMGKVVVRFPPEASGYLHIGHAKAALLNQYYQKAFNGKLIMRFDDTNPAKENAQFEKEILHDLSLLQVQADRYSYTSDFFLPILSYCERLLSSGHFYVDDTPADLMKAQREARKASKNRDNTVQRNLEMWKEMVAGSEYGQCCCVRAKIDMNSNNGCMRDPTMYRCKNEPHIRTGTEFRVYPTYDFACPIVDSLEGVTHALRTTEYHDRDEQYYWLIDVLALRKPHVWEYARLNMMHTVLSKRKLTWLVDQGLVEGWDDPRFPTVRGILRRGLTVEGLRQFIVAQGSSKSVVTMDWDKIWSFNKKVIDPTAHRYVALDKESAIDAYVDAVPSEFRKVQLHPKDVTQGTKDVYFGKHMLIDREDATTFAVGDVVTFINLGNVEIGAVERDDSDNVVTVRGRYTPENLDFKNTTKITWLGVCEDGQGSDLCSTVCVKFDYLIAKPVLGKDEDFKKCINPNPTWVEREFLGEPALATLRPGQIIQLLRQGYFICDAPYVALDGDICREMPLRLFSIPDGHTKDMPTTGSKSSREPVPHRATVPKMDKSQTDTDFISGAVPNVDGQALGDKIRIQGELVRKLKAEKAPKAQVEAGVGLLLGLKSQYKTATGLDWKPPTDQRPFGAPAKDDPETCRKPGENRTGAPLRNETNTNGDVHALHDDIRRQGDLVRKLKGEKAPKAEVDASVKLLLSLKSEFKAAFGMEWKPASEQPLAPPAKDDRKTPPSQKASVPNLEPDHSEGQSSPFSINTLIVAQGDLVRTLKSDKSNTKEIVSVQVEKLLELKRQFRSVSGVDWKPGMDLAGLTIRETTDGHGGGQSRSNGHSDGLDQESAALDGQIRAQGDKVRQLKASKSDKAALDTEIQALLGLKARFKTLLGQEWKPTPTTCQATAGSSPKSAEIPPHAVTSTKKSAKTSVQPKVVKKEEDKSSGAGKKVSRLGLEIGKEENFSDWYTQVITKAEMIEYYDVSGCYILRPWSYAIWEAIKDFFDREIKKLGVQNVYFPIFVSQQALETEKSHIADFSPEVAWVTRSGDSELAEPIAIRPTSETVMYPAYAKWIKSYRDLPLKLNQWNNVVRWEFKHPTPFIRTREFLWQEGHSAFGNYQEAEEEVYTILELYARVYQDLLAIPVIKGRKTEKEKFAGGDYTTTVEAYIETCGRGIQGATSHHLGQNFSKIFEIVCESPDTGDKMYVYQNSWGITTRTIGVMVMVHGDDLGLILPPAVAPIQVVVIPCGITVNLSDADRGALVKKCEEIGTELNAGGIRTKADVRDNYSPGWKFNHWELKGVPLRIELGPKELANGTLMIARRDEASAGSAARKIVSVGDGTLGLPNAPSALVKLVNQKLDEVQTSLFEKAKVKLNRNLVVIKVWDTFCSHLDQKHIIQAPFCGEMDCEEQIKKLSTCEDTTDATGSTMGAKSLCIPFEQPEKITAGTKCIRPGCTVPAKFYTLFGRSY